MNPGNHVLRVRFWVNKVTGWPCGRWISTSAVTGMYLNPDKNPRTTGENLPKRIQLDVFIKLTCRSKRLWPRQPAVKLLRNCELWGYFYFKFSRAVEKQQTAGDQTIMYFIPRSRKKCKDSYEAIKSKYLDSSSRKSIWFNIQIVYPKVWSS